MAAVLSAALLAGCSSSTGPHSVSLSVFSLRPGDCLAAPKSVTEQIATVTAVPCSAAHTQEVYAVVTYTGPGATDPSNYPGDPNLTQFANGACAARYQSYVGIAYQDSKYFFTYLLPSPRSWEQGHDRSVVCLVTTTGAVLYKSVKGSRT
ncbi:MAG: septum formation family protein [Mycobacteriales bacterium]